MRWLLVENIVLTCPDQKPIFSTAESVYSSTSNVLSELFCPSEALPDVRIISH